MSKEIHPPKAYKNDDFLNSGAARNIRVLCEMSEPEARFKEENIQDTLVYFGSARSIPEVEAKANLEGLEKALKDPANPSTAETGAISKAKAQLKLAPYYDAAVELSSRMTKWSIALRNPQLRFISCTGGGPGMMEAANRGAQNAKGASIGLGISLPFEQGLNPYVTPDLAFEFHYFFVRKYCFAYWAKAIVVFPGGFGTMDELFELMTLIQTGKISKKMPIVLFGAKFWNDILNFDAFVEWGVISPSDLDLFKIVDTVEEAEEFLIAELSALYL
jgi:uncharacterized protein (TIGR00730 family)|tara:strand:- start:51627 stop:52451 length:825 start_codon:yes stop_codon:yes gene_type:complete